VTRERAERPPKHLQNQKSVSNTNSATSRLAVVPSNRYRSLKPGDDQI
jgi:hypothetical protein